MPVKRVPGGYQWGNQKVYKTRAKAERQGQAIRRSQAMKRKTTINLKKRKK